MSAIEQQLTLEERQKIEARLANYTIPLQILHMVAEQSGDLLDTTIAGRASSKQSKLLLSRLGDKAIVMLQQIFLDCQDSHSGFRLAVYLSSKHGQMTHKFVMNEKVAGDSGAEYSFDVCIYSRQTGTLKAVAMQNNSVTQEPSDNKAIAEFLNTIHDIGLAHHDIDAAYYSSSYGYQNALPAKRHAAGGDDTNRMEIKFLEYSDKMYFENRQLSSKFAGSS